MSSPTNPSQSPPSHPMRATPVIAGSLSGLILLAVCIITMLLLRRRRDRRREERALRMAGFLHSDRRSLTTTTPPPADPDKPATTSSSRHHRHHRSSHPPTQSSILISSPSPSHPRPASSHSRINRQLTNRTEIGIAGEENSNNRMRRGRTSNSDVILAHQDAGMERLDGDSAGALIPSIVVSEGGLPGARIITSDRTDGRILPPHSTDTRPPSRRPNGSTIPSLTPQSPLQPSSTLLHPTFDSSSTVSSSASFPSPSLSSSSSSPTLPSSSYFTASSKHLASTQNNLSMHDDGIVPSLSTSLRKPAVEAGFIGPSLRRDDVRGEDDAPPAYESV